MPHKSHHAHETKKSEQKAEQARQEEQNKSPDHLPNDDFAKIGPLSIQGVEAHDLPDGGRTPEENFAHEIARRTPAQTGEVRTPNPDDVSDGQSGLRAESEVKDADVHGGRKKN